MPLSAAAAGVLCARLYGRGLSATSCGLDLLIALCMYSLLPARAFFAATHTRSGCEALLDRYKVGANSVRGHMPS